MPNYLSKNEEFSALAYEESAISLAFLSTFMLKIILKYQFHQTITPQPTALFPLLSQRIIQEVSGNMNLEELQKYLEVLAFVNSQQFDAWKSCSVDARSFSGYWYTATFHHYPVESLQVGQKGNHAPVEFVIQLSKKVLLNALNNCQSQLDPLTNHL